MLVQTSVGTTDLLLMKSQVTSFLQTANRQVIVK
jgi:hypothetical protein